MIDFYSGLVSGITQTVIGYPLDTMIVYKQTGGNIKNLQFKYIYRGFQYPLFSNGVISGLCFEINSNIYKKNIHNHYISGALTGFITSFIISPIELYKIRSQKLKPINVNPFIGLKITIGREVIATSIYFGLFNTLINNNNNIFISGGITGCLYWIITYPIDVIKTRVQSGECNTIYQSIKMKNLWKGISICLCRAFIVNSVGLYTYEKFRNL